MPSKPDFRIRLNGTFIPEIRVQRETPGGEIQLVVRDEDLGWFVVDNNEGLVDGLPRFALEYRDETSWALLPKPLRQSSEDMGWNRTTPDELIEVLQFTGVLR